MWAFNLKSLHFSMQPRLRTLGYVCSKTPQSWVLSVFPPYGLVTISVNSVYKYKSQIFPGGSDGKESACDAGDLGLIPGLGRSPGEGNGTHSSIFAWRIHGQRSLVAYSPGGLKE